MSSEQPQNLFERSRGLVNRLLIPDQKCRGLQVLLAPVADQNSIRERHVRIPIEIFILPQHANGHRDRRFPFARRVHLAGYQVYGCRFLAQ